jgi:hypothetical protein
MQPSSVEQIDRAALALLEVLTAHGDELAPYLETGHVVALEQEIVSLRRALLGLQMGPLYWETPAEGSAASSGQRTSFSSGAAP